MLEPDTLRALIEHFIAREGTEHGQVEYSMETKIAQVMRQLQRNEATVVFDPETETCDIRALS